MPAELPHPETAAHRREQHHESMRYVFGGTAGLYYACCADFFHFAVFEDGEERSDRSGHFAGAVTESGETPRGSTLQR